jgi:RNA polymerase sigma-70 factor (ECF subfamily)
VTTRDVTLSGLERLGDATDTLDVTFHMDEDTFRAFYDRTARGVWAYISRTTGDNRLADDLMQETYYRFLRAGGSHDSETHRRHYLFRIAVNLVRDHYRRPRVNLTWGLPPADHHQHPQTQSGEQAADRAAQRIDLTRAMARLTKRERDLLWLAYAQGASHEEVAASLGLKTASIKSLLFRARRRLALLLGREGAGPGGITEEKTRRERD